ncbi:hypothetical protein FVE85_5703 [Porphyridium purpureum]|uniref:Uncharacterized protein n=1 Tax=Porphyridium purpureum TaxID=35688 RepID=A0A5J4Z4H3_PORPP|nr:hypothetical protein FVE85_5703 [Porphyridium purpureum]|eukprot:POR8628..scf295_1
MGSDEFMDVFGEASGPKIHRPSLCVRLSAISAAASRGVTILVSGNWLPTGFGTGKINPFTDTNKHRRTNDTSTFLTAMVLIPPKWSILRPKAIATPRTRLAVLALLPCAKPD